MTCMTYVCFVARFSMLACGHYCLCRRH